jgi:hypothetical protein
MFSKSKSTSSIDIMGSPLKRHNSTRYPKVEGEGR